MVTEGGRRDDAVAPSDVPVAAISDYLENIVRKMIQGGIPAERVVEAVKLTAVRVQALCPAERMRPRISAIPKHSHPAPSQRWRQRAGMWSVLEK